jgi:hypothetical protein
MEALAPTLNYQPGDIGSVPVLPGVEQLAHRVSALVSNSKADWDSFETSWDFQEHPILRLGRRSLSDAISEYFDSCCAKAEEQRLLEAENNRAVAGIYGLEETATTDVPLATVSLSRNAEFRYGADKTRNQRQSLFTREIVIELLSYAVGCMFGRFQLEGFTADEDNVIPVTTGDWFDDDIEARFRQFLRVAFGDATLQENLQFIEETLGKSVRQYFLKDFYKDHVKRYKNRPIYWMFSSRAIRRVSSSRRDDDRDSFSALIYLHRYTPATLNTLLNEYLREFQEKLRGTINSLEGSTDAAANKRADALRPVLTECEDYERNILYPLALGNPEIDLDDGVLVNYLRFGRAVLRIKAIEDKRSDVEDWTWPKNPLRREDA